MTEDERNWFISLRGKVFDLIRKILADDPMCKSYEGLFEISAQYGDYFEEYSTEPEIVVITLHCYLLGKGRHHQFRGKTFEDALCRLQEQVDEWWVNYGQN